ncbi:MAG: CopY family transcriptional regulator [Calothrix sp. CSU_2_0]|nr:CopY family transcriptional regulator [Calothrix sp. CSU_2_0]
MNPLPNHRPKKLKLGKLEAEILDIVFSLGVATAREIYERIMTDPERELTYSSVATILDRLTKKGWLVSDTTNHQHSWQPLISREEAQILQVHEELQKFLEVGNPDIVAAFADHLDEATCEQINAIAKLVEAARKAREDSK